MQRRVHIDRVPEHDDVDHQTEGAELVFLAFAIALPQLSALAMEHHAGELMAPLAAIASLPLGSVSRTACARSVAPDRQTESPAARLGRFYLPPMRPVLTCRYWGSNFTEIDERRNMRLRYTDEAINDLLQISITIK